MNEQSVSAVRILAIGLIPYAIGSMYLALIHAYARPDITAKAHLFEMPLFLCALYWAIAEYGIIGAAITWVGRTVMDALVLIFWFHQFGGPGFKKSAIDSKT